MNLVTFEMLREKMLINNYQDTFTDFKMKLNKQ